MPPYIFSEETYEDEDAASRQYNYPMPAYTRSEVGDYRTYEAGEARFSPSDLPPEALPALGALRELGATRVRCRYDGGGDEGFAHFEWAQVAGQSVRLKDLQARLSKGELGQAPSDPRNYPPYYLSLSREERVREALDYLAHGIAAKMLGDGFGTGDYSLYGALEADLISGQIVDDPDASDPHADARGNDAQDAED